MLNLFPSIYYLAWTTFFEMCQHTQLWKSPLCDKLLCLNKLLWRSTRIYENQSCCIAAALEAVIKKKQRKKTKNRLKKWVLKMNTFCLLLFIFDLSTHCSAIYFYDMFLPATHCCVVTHRVAPIGSKDGSNLRTVAVPSWCVFQFL